MQICLSHAWCADLSRRLLGPGGIEDPPRGLDNLWATCSSSFVELSIVIYASDTNVCIAAANQLKALNSLDICVHPRSYLPEDDGLPDQIYFSEIESRSYIIDLPGLKSLSLTSLDVIDVTLVCPSLRSLTLTRCDIRGRLSLQASLEHVCCEGCSTFGIHEGFPVSNLLGLTCLQIHMPCCMNRDELYSILPRMSKLRALDMLFRESGLPWPLPASLKAIRYYFAAFCGVQSRWESEDFQRISHACQLPELQSISLVNWHKFKPDELLALQQITEEGGGKLSVKYVMMGEDFSKPWNAYMDEPFCRSFL